jgi:hypothetical protein
LADLALAILNDARSPGDGLLPQRLRDMGVDLDAGSAAVERLLATDDEDFSASVRKARDVLGPGTSVTAAQITAALQRIHPEYGGDRRRFGDVHLRTSLGATAPTEDWLARVHDLYDLAHVATTRHELIDGELTLLASLGLVELDGPLAEDLRTNWFLRALSAGAAVRPRHMRADHTAWADDAVAEHDRLGRQYFARALADRMQLLAEPAGTHRSSFLVHLDGPWGAGKSSVLGFLKKELGEAFLIVEINAWREQRMSVQWWTILHRLQHSVTASKQGIHRPAARLAGLVDRIRAGWLSLVMVLLIAGLLVGAVVAGFDLTSGGAAADNAVKIILLA